MFLTKLTRRNQRSTFHKKLNWLAWAQKILTKRGTETDVDSCAYGKIHLPYDVKPLGGGWMFYSKACSGCAISKLGLDRVNPKGTPNCALLAFPLLTLDEVKEGQQFKLSTFVGAPPE